MVVHSYNPSIQGDRGRREVEARLGYTRSCFKQKQNKTNRIWVDDILE